MPEEGVAEPPTEEHAAAATVSPPPEEPRARPAPWSNPVESMDYKPRSWKIDAIASLGHLNDWLAMLWDEPSVDTTALDLICGHLAEARAIIDVKIPRSRWFHRLAAWYSGQAVESTWAALHNAEELLVLNSRTGTSAALALETAIEHAKLLPEDHPARADLRTSLDHPAAPRHDLAPAQNGTLRSGEETSDANSAPAPVPRTGPRPRPGKHRI